MPHKTEGSVLGQDADPFNTGMHQVTHGKINDTVQSPEGQRGLGPQKGQNAQVVNPSPARIIATMFVKYPPARLFRRMLRKIMEKIRTEQPRRTAVVCRFNNVFSEHVL